MEGTPNAERLIQSAEKVFIISQENYNRAYSICLGMKIVYANEKEELKVLFERLIEAGFQARK